MKIVGQPVPHESARGHVTGEALYTDDLPSRFPQLLHAWPVLAPHAHAQLIGLNVAPALDQPSVCATLTASDVPGEGDSGAVRHDEPLFPKEIMFHQQPVAWVLGETLEAARLGAARVQAEYQPLPAILTIEDAIQAGYPLEQTGLMLEHVHRQSARGHVVPPPRVELSLARRVGEEVEAPDRWQQNQGGPPETGFHCRRPSLGETIAPAFTRTSIAAGAAKSTASGIASINLDVVAVRPGVDRDPGPGEDADPRVDTRRCDH